MLAFLAVLASLPRCMVAQCHYQYVPPESFMMNFIRPGSDVFLDVRFCYFDHCRLSGPTEWLGGGAIDLNDKTSGSDSNIADSMFAECGCS
jgi:hypothetical protein